MNVDELRIKIALVIQQIAIHQRPRWGVLLEHRRQFEGWWKAEIAMALDSWTYSSDAGWERGKRAGFGVLLEQRENDDENRQLCDLLVGPWANDTIDRTRGPHVWIELKCCADWWSNAKKAFDPFHADLAKWRSLESENVGVLCCLISASSGAPSTRWNEQLERVRLQPHVIDPVEVCFELSEGTQRWLRVDCVYPSSEDA